ncbi:energy transducer TonB [Pontibacter sp. MBLB2868]|uniref:energy transducer TonB n=1 Tax=Pontibacter sp. MBLB2868 TaxID=3451555 RepID=UPI003F74F120
MNKNYYLSATFNEVVFKDRNKVYGAFELRQKYEKHVIAALFIAIVVFSSVLATPLIKNMFFASTDKSQLPIIETDDRVITDVIVIPPLPDKPKIEEQVVAAKKQQVKTEVYAETKVVPDDAKVETRELANQEDLKEANFGTQKIEGTPPTIPDIKIVDAPPAGLGDGSAKNEPEIFIIVEEMPEFIGGEKAMLQYLSKKINYPAMAQRQGIEGLVVVSFIVSETGKIRDVEVIKGLGSGTDEEALRVVRNMPDWKPGKQNSRKVPVRYTLPIRFSLK